MTLNSQCIVHAPKVDWDTYGCWFGDSPDVCHLIEKLKTKGHKVSTKCACNPKAVIVEPLNSLIDGHGHIPTYYLHNKFEGVS